jgi:hypothetical protein
MLPSLNTTEPSALLGPRIPWGGRIPLLVSIACVAALALWVERGSEPRAWLVGIAALGLGGLALRQTGGVARFLGWGAAVVVASLGPYGDYPQLEVCGVLGAVACAAAASVSIARIPAGGGMVRAPPSSAVMPSGAIVVLWAIAIVARLVRPNVSAEWMAEYPDAWALLAAAATAIVLLVQVEMVARRRRLELGIAERSLAMRVVLWACFAAMVALAAVGHSRAAALARLLVALASALVAAAALQTDAAVVARLTRRVLIAILGGAIALVGASMLGGEGTDPWGTVLVATVLALAIAAVSPALEGPLLPARGVWIDAFSHAGAAPSRADPEDLIRDVLLALRATAGLSAPAPELWTVSPSCATRVDPAGYLHRRDAELPTGLMVAAMGEPEATLRAEVLDALEVRRPELRPWSKWMTEHGASLVTLVACDGEPEGVLVFPWVARDEPPTLEEVRALKRVADRLAAACRARAARESILARASEANRRAELADEDFERMSHERALDAGRDALATMRLARPATIGVYAAGSRMALEAIERRTAVGAPIAVVAPSGIDPVPYLARAHLAGARRDAPLVLIEATSAREHDLARWSDPRASPLALADRGMLVLIDGAALPPGVQQLVARALGEKRAPWDRPAPLDVQLAFTAVAKPEMLVAQGRLESALAVRLADACESPVVLPRLLDRVEDLRAIITDRLAREGLRVFGRPVGIEQAAYACLIEHPFAGEEGELAVIVKRLVARCIGDVVRVADVLSACGSLAGGLRSDPAAEVAQVAAIAGARPPPSGVRSSEETPQVRTPEVERSPSVPPAGQSTTRKRRGRRAG